MTLGSIVLQRAIPSASLPSSLDTASMKGMCTYVHMHLASYKPVLQIRGHSVTSHTSCVVGGRLRIRNSNVFAAFTVDKAITTNDAVIEPLTKTSRLVPTFHHLEKR